MNELPCSLALFRVTHSTINLESPNLKKLFKKIAEMNFKCLKYVNFYFH